MSERGGKQFTAFVPDGLVRRIAREIRREKFVTPYMVSERYSMTMSLARQVLKRLEKEGVVERYAPNRRAPIYLVKQQKK